MLKKFNVKEVAVCRVEIISNEVPRQIYFFANSEMNSVYCRKKLSDRKKIGYCYLKVKNNMFMSDNYNTTTYI